MLRSFFLSAVTMTVALSLDTPLPFVSPSTLAGLALQVATAFVGLVKERLVAFGYSGERTAFILLQGTPYLVPSGVAVRAFDLTKKDRKAIASNPSDFEDAVQYFSALQAGADLIITRDTNGFQGFDLPVMTPAEFLARCAE